MRKSFGIVLLLLMSSMALGSDKLPPSVELWRTYEQQHVNRVVGPKIASPEQNDQNPKYAPESGNIFELPAFWLDASEAQMFEANNLPRRLRSMFVRGANSKKQFLILVHPESLAMFKSVLKDATPYSGKFLATPTSSSRTLFVWPKGQADQVFLVKVALDATIGSARRIVSKLQVTHSIALNNVIQHINQELPDSFVGLPEVLGMVPNELDREGGMIVRSIPDELLAGKVRYVPMFALCATPAKGGEPLIEALAKASKVSVVDFMESSIIKPFVREWLTMFLESGMVGEPHGQNLLLEIDAQNRPTGRFVHRDFHGFDADFEYRKKMRLPIPSRKWMPKTTSGDFTRKSPRNPIQEHFTNSLDIFFGDGVVFTFNSYARKAGYSRDLKAVFKRVVIEQVESMTGTQYKTYEEFIEHLNSDAVTLRQQYRKTAKNQCSVLRKVVGG